MPIPNHPRLTGPMVDQLRKERDLSLGDARKQLNKIFWLEDAKTCRTVEELRDVVVMLVEAL